MKTLRHRVGRWLLRDAPKPSVKIVTADIDAARILAAISKHRRLRGDGTAGA